MRQVIFLFSFVLIFTACSQPRTASLDKQYHESESLVLLYNKAMSDLNNSIKKTESIGIYLKGGYSHSIPWLYGPNLFLTKNEIYLKKYNQDSFLEPNYGISNTLPLYISKVSSLPISVLREYADKEGFSTIKDLYESEYKKYYKIDPKLFNFMITNLIKKNVFSYEDFIDKIKENKLVAVYMDNFRKYNVSSDLLYINDRNNKVYLEPSDFTYESLVVTILSLRVLSYYEHKNK